jgi:hypothetical protein
VELKPPQIIVTPSSSLSTSSSSDEASANSSSALNSNENVLSNVDTLGIAVRPNILSNHAEITQDEMIDDEDFCSSDEEDVEAEVTDTPTKKPTSFFKSRLMKGVSLGNLKFSFHSSASPQVSPKMKKSMSSSFLLEKEEMKQKHMTKSAAESFNSETSDLYYSMCDATTKEHWHVDVSNINYFLNQTGIQEHPVVRNSMSPITKSTQRMPKSMQVE